MKIQNESNIKIDLHILFVNANTCYYAAHTQKKRLKIDYIFNCKSHSEEESVWLLELSGLQKCCDSMDYYSLTHSK